MNEALFFCFGLSIFGLFLLLINTGLFLSRLKNRNKEYKIVTIYLVTMFFVEVFCNVSGYLNPGKNDFSSHIYFNSQFLTLSIFFYKILNHSTLRKIVIANYIVISCIILVGYAIDINTFWSFNLFEIVSISTSLILYSLIHLYRTLDKEKHYFFFCIGLILYLMCSCLIFTSGNYELVFMKDPYLDIWIFNTLFYILYQVLIFKEWLYLIRK